MLNLNLETILGKLQFVNQEEKPQNGQMNLSNLYIAMKLNQKVFNSNILIVNKKNLVSCEEYDSLSKHDMIGSVVVPIANLIDISG